MSVKQLAQLSRTLRQAHTGLAILIGNACQLGDELADGFIHVQVPAPDHIFLLALCGAANGHADLDDGAAGLVVLQVQGHIGLRVNQGLRRGGHVWATCHRKYWPVYVTSFSGPKPVDFKIVIGDLY